LRSADTSWGLDGTAAGVLVCVGVLLSDIPAIVEGDGGLRRAPSVYSFHNNISTSFGFHPMSLES